MRRATQARPRAHAGGLAASRLIGHVDTGEAHDPRLDGTDRRDEQSLTARAASGLGWSSIGYGALMVANLAYTMTISRLVDPVAFGLMALAQLVVLFAQFFVRMGLASALVQKPVLSEDDIRAASTAGLAIGVVCFGLVWVLAPLFGTLFRRARSASRPAVAGRHLPVRGPGDGGDRLVAS